MSLDYQAQIAALRERHELLLSKPNIPEEYGNGIYTRYKNPILTAEHTPLEWRYDFNAGYGSFFNVKCHHSVDMGLNP